MNAVLSNPDIHVGAQRSMSVIKPSKNSALSASPNGLVKFVVFEILHIIFQPEKLQNKGKRFLSTSRLLVREIVKMQR